MVRRTLICVPKPGFERGAAKMQFGSYLERCLILDLEVGTDGRIRDVGAILGDQELRLRGVSSSVDAVRRLCEFGSDASVVVGHNIVAHDNRFIEAHLPGARILGLPVVDTLYLAPLARPQRPYHHLVKDYKLVRQELSDPVADCRLARRLLEDCWNTLAQRERERPGLVSIYRGCFDDSDAPGGESPLRLDGTGELLESLGARMLTRERTVRGFGFFAADKGCPSAIARRLPSLLDGPMTRPAAAYALAWLTVAGTESVLPRWVHRRFPAAVEFLHAVRAMRCGDATCGYCSVHHNPAGKLKEYFGFDGFRPTPATSDGESLQERIVTHGIERTPMLAILPTGGGKSLCYQLPAIIHNERTGALTVVISPLQALMKDQVENLNRRTESVELAASLSGLLTMPERHNVLEAVRLGRFALLYVSPEQLRSPSFASAVRQREIATWVFDEAHCISKWGHDFRTDYHYAARFIREFSEREKIDVAPVACFTATAKLDVQNELCAHFEKELGQDLKVLLADRVDRNNLRYFVEEVLTPRKGARLHELLVEHIGEPRGSAHRGSAIVYAARRKRTQELATELSARGWNVHHFHAGLEPPEKKRVQDAFVSGELPVIVATNAFGMGIDKPDVRLVVHADIPGSIESYLQEAGRAGRDGEPATCVLLHAEGDLETQFDLSARSRLTQRDIAQILGAIRKARRKGVEEIVVSPGDLLRVPETDVSFNERERSASTKVKTAISWLERAEFVTRNENRTRVFQGNPAVQSVEEAEKRIEELDLPEHVKQRWREVIEALIGAGVREGIDADHLAHLPSFQRLRSRVGESTLGIGRTASREILRTLHEMTRAGLIESGVYLSAFVRHKTRGRSLDRLAQVLSVERRVAELLRAEHPDLSIGEEVQLSLPRLQEQLRSDGLQVASETTLKLLSGWTRQEAKRHPAIAVQGGGRRGLRVTFQVEWDALFAQLELRANVAQVVLESLLAIASEMGLVGERLVAFSLEIVRKAIDEQLMLAQQIGDPFDAIEKALLFLDEHGVITLQKGLAIFRQAMTIKLLETAKGRSYSGRQYTTLKQYYNERVIQIHAMGRYVEQVRDGLDGGQRYVHNYFHSPSGQFLKQYFADDPEVLDRATSRDSYAAIVECLQHRTQEEIVTAPRDRNLLVLAGPGSGKTRVVVHRCAYLLRVERIRPEHILVVCFNRSAMQELRLRLRQLVGDLARHVAVHTYHSLALRLTERSLADRVAAAGEGFIDFDAVIDEANDRLSGRNALVGVEPDDLRDRLLSGFEYVLVDEFQDIDHRQYELISHIARRVGGDADPDRAAAILAVGDDDQSIYGFRDANIRYVREFEREFDAEPVYLVDNYRSTKRIVDAANALIGHNADRMKVEYPIRVNSARTDDSPGGELQLLDSVGEGCVSMLDVADGAAQAGAVVAEIERLCGLDPKADWSRFVVLGRSHRRLAAVRVLLERNGIPIRRVLRTGLPPLRRTREFVRLLAFLERVTSPELSVADLRSQLGEICGAASLWTQMADRVLLGVNAELGDEPCPVAHVLDSLHRALADHHRSHIVGDGVLVSTVHAAKGLEARHVVVLGGGWGPRSRRSATGRGPEDPEEVRRLYYVAMTRAQNTLTLISRRDDPLPFGRELAEDSLRRRVLAIAESATAGVDDIEYSVLGMRDLFIDFAGQCAEGRAIHRAIAGLTAGDQVEFEPAGRRMFVRTQGGVRVACLAASSVDQWLAQFAAGQVEEVRVLGVATRLRDDCAPAFQPRIEVPRWELPILEVRHRLPSVR